MGELTDKHKKFIATLETVRIEEFIRSSRGMPWRPPKDRAEIARAFVGKMVYNLETTRSLLDRLASDPTFKQICGWSEGDLVPSESKFSRAFAEFAASHLPARVHKVLIEQTHQDRLVGHISRDATKIEARERPVKKAAAPKERPKHKRGRPKKGQQPAPKEPTRLEQQSDWSLLQCLEELPKACDVGAKRNSKGHRETWIGYALHIDTADGDIPVSCILTSASLHDSQVAIPLAKMTASRLTNLYDVMDSTYDAAQIKQHSRSLGHVPIIEVNPRTNKTLKEELATEAKRLRAIHFQMPEAVRYNQRTASERVNGRLKDEFGGRNVRVRGHAKVLCHLMFGIIALAVDQLLRFVPSHAG
ncbi:MAG: transposase [Deltaproteobacteria bacterium]|nr:transposase [Deltaproteobacteria bacterium]